MLNKLVVLIATILVGVPMSDCAYASFHLYRINELYSNADGSVQFIELTVGNTSGEGFWAGQTIGVSQGSLTHSFTFPGNLPSTATANTSVLIATQGFVDLGIVTPDFIIPAGFLFTNGGTVNYANVDSVTYSALPTSGNLSLNRNGATGVNSPKNFSGVSGSVAAGSSSGTTVDPLSDCLFAWAETTFSQYFAPPGSQSLASGSYYFRFYSGTGTYLATSSADSHVWIYGPLTGNTLFDAGPTAGYLSAAGCKLPDRAPANGYGYGDGY